jgi:hypothetical protein
MRVHCTGCQTNFTELPDDAILSPDFKFTCKDCYGPDNRVQGLGIAHDPRLDRAGTPDGTAARRPRPEEISQEEFVREGFQLDRKEPKPIKPGPTWSRSDAFLSKLVSDLGEKERQQALVVMHGRWRRGFTFWELATATGLLVAEVRALLSVLRTKGDAVMEKRERAEAKFKKNGELSVRAKELFERGLTTREVAAIMECSLGYASELRRAS